MAPASGGSRSVRRSKTAGDDSDQRVVTNTTKKPGASGPSTPVQQPQAQQPGSRPGCAAPNEGVQSDLAHKVDAEASSRKRRSSEDVSTQKPKRAKRNRRAEGFPPNYCFQPLNQKLRYEKDEISEPTAAATQDAGQQSPNQILAALDNDPTYKEAFQAEIFEADTDAKKLGKLLTMFKDTRADGELLAQGISPVALPPSARAPTSTYATAASDSAQGTYQFPSQPAWPSQKYRGGRGRGNQTPGGRGGHSNPLSQATTPYAVNNASARPAANTTAQRPATRVAPAANSAAQTGQKGQSQSADQAARHGQGVRSIHQSSGSAGVGLVHGRGRGGGRGGSASA